MKTMRRFAKISQSQRRPLIANRALNVKALVDSFNQEKALVGAFSMIVKSSRTFG